MKYKRLRWPLAYGMLLAVFTVYVLLDAFVIPRSYVVVDNGQSAQEDALSSDVQSGVGSSSPSESDDSSVSSADVTITSDAYNDGNISIQITQYREYDTTIYVAGVTLSSADELKTMFADNTYGKNVTETTSDIADACGAILAINGDYYSARSGYVIRNGVLYRDTSAGQDQEDLVIYDDGTMAVVSEGDYTAQELLDGGAEQVLSFGPGLVENGQISVTTAEEVDKAKVSNPRTAIGQIDSLHYVLVVADGRTSESKGLSLYEMAEFLQGLGVKNAYNLDGGGSSTMVFNGAVVNNPTTNGKKITEREVSDIVYIG